MAVLPNVAMSVYMVGADSYYVPTICPHVEARPKLASAIPDRFVAGEVAVSPATCNRCQNINAGAFTFLEQSFPFALAATAVNIDYQQFGRRAGDNPDVGLRKFCPPLFYLRAIGSCILEAMFGSRMLTGPATFWVAALALSI
jgi:hypothetical protein